MATLTLEQALKNSHDEMVASIKHTVKQQKRDAEKIDATYEFLNKAQELGVPVVFPSSSYGAAHPEIEITNEAHLPFIRRIVGPIEHSHFAALHDDARKTEVKQVMSVGNDDADENGEPKNKRFKHIRFWQKKKLSKKDKETKCKLRRVNTSYVALVCD